jgi:CDP-glucose 4,6-dehydratase
MLLAEKLAEQPSLKGEAFNFSNELQVTVREIVERILVQMKSTLKPDIRNEADKEILHQYLSAEKARRLLDWKPLFSLDNALVLAINWYKNYLGVE